MGNYNSTKSLGLSQNQKRNTIIPFNYILHNEIERSIKSRRTISETKSNLSSASQKKVKNNPFFKRSHFHKKISSIKTISNLIHSFHKIKTDNIHRITVIEGFFSIKNLIKKEDEPSFFICEPITKNVDNSVSMFLSPEEADMINKICRTETSSNKKLKQVRKSLKPPVPTIKINLKEVVAESQRSTNNNTKNVLKAKKTMTKSRTKNVLGPFKFKNKIMAKTKISISLIKEGLQDENVIKERLPYVELPNGNRLYYNHSVSRTPKWVNSFFGEDIPNDALFQTKSVSALLLYNVEIREGIHRLFAICFGYGRNLLRTDVTERRFGLITVLNLVDEKKIRSVDTNSMGASPRNNRIQTSLLSNMMGFNIDKDKDILKAVAGKTSELDEFSGMLSGTDSLSLTTDLKYNNIDELLVNCYVNYQRSDYKEKFPWIDKMTEVKDKNIIQSLHDEVIEKFYNKRTGGGSNDYSGKIYGQYQRFY